VNLRASAANVQDLTFSMALPSILTPTPRVCHRCYTALPKRARICPNCAVPQVRPYIAAGVFSVLLAIAALMLLAGAGWVVYRVFDIV